MSDKLIIATNLKKSFDQFIAVDNIDLSVSRGEVVGFLGPNGAGKSTTMKMLTGFLEPDSGQIFINNINLKSDPLKAKEYIGYLPEGAPSYSDMIVADFLSFIGKMRGLNDNSLSNRLEEMANQINLKEMWNRPIETLSKGFKRRVGIAQALIHDPDILILDEPTDGLDPNQKHEMRNLIKRISTNKAIVISTHILEEVEAVCSRAVIISNGKLLANDTPKNLENEFLNKNTLSIKVSNKINNVFFFRNRLGFLASDNVILSTVSEFFNFFPETVLSVIDSDPIDVAASHTKVAILKNAVNMGEKLILFSDQTQFVLSSSADNLTPKTANILVATEFESSDGATPVGAGSSIYYLTKKGNFSGVREYITQTGIEVRDAANITIHVPKLIPNDIYKIAVTTLSLIHI